MLADAEAKWFLRIFGRIYLIKIWNIHTAVSLLSIVKVHSASHLSVRIQSRHDEHSCKWIFQTKVSCLHFTPAHFSSFPERAALLCYPSCKIRFLCARAYFPWRTTNAAYFSIVFLLPVAVVNARVIQVYSHNIATLGGILLPSFWPDPRARTTWLRSISEKKPIYCARKAPHGRIWLAGHTSTFHSSLF